MFFTRVLGISKNSVEETYNKQAYAARILLDFKYWNTILLGLTFDHFMIV